MSTITHCPKAFGSFVMTVLQVLSPRCTLALVAVGGTAGNITANGDKEVVCPHTMFLSVSREVVTSTQAPPSRCRNWIAAFCCGVIPASL